MRQQRQELQQCRVTSTGLEAGLLCSRSHVHSQVGGACVLSSDVPLPLLSQDELDNERAEKKKVSDVLEELAQRREELQVQV